MIKKGLLLFCTVFLLSSCSLYHVNYEDVSENFYPAKASVSEVRYLEEVEPPYEVIGTVTINTERRQGLEDIIEKMKREAAALGGDAITNISTDASGSWKKLPPHRLLANAYIRANFTATIVKFTDSRGDSSAPSPSR